MVRLPLAFAFSYLLIKQDLEKAFVMVLIAGLSDKLDGTIARKLGLGDSLWGRILDPLADRIFMVFAFGSFYFVNLEINVSSWVVFLTVVQDILLAPLGAYIFFKKRKPLGSPLGKPVTFYQYSFLILVLALNLWRIEIDLLPLELLLVVLNFSSAVHHVLLWLREKQS
ncbi:MAG: CDP-alcohol phosphatidyltransferase family protein [Caldimicrobium sp.]|nr:CDP-alcohol phosphatidyltransferase family protein [Caldimicrobium sp.]MCX7613458.1 CDP-alcohol phosphatidyltransferase family protein [Caldimicrobium sp.]